MNWHCVGSLNKSMRTKLTILSLLASCIISACGNGGTVPKSTDSIFDQRTDTSPVDHTNTYLDSTAPRSGALGDSTLPPNK